MSYGTNDPANCVQDRTPRCTPPGARLLWSQPPAWQRGHAWKRGNINKAVTRARRRSGVNHHLKIPGPWLPDRRRP